MNSKKELNLRSYWRRSNRSLKKCPNKSNFFKLKKMFLNILIKFWLMQMKKFKKTILLLKMKTSNWSNKMLKLKNTKRLRKVWESNWKWVFIPKMLSEAMFYRLIEIKTVQSAMKLSILRRTNLWWFAGSNIWFARNVLIMDGKVMSVHSAELSLLVVKSWRVDKRSDLLKLNKLSSQSMMLISLNSGKRFVMKTCYYQLKWLVKKYKLKINLK